MKSLLSVLVLIGCSGSAAQNARTAKAICLDVVSAGVMVLDESKKMDVPPADLAAVLCGVGVLVAQSVDPGVAPRVSKRDWLPPTATVAGAGGEAAGTASTSGGQPTAGDTQTANVAARHVLRRASAALTQRRQ
jgi:hypothetical protein